MFKYCKKGILIMLSFLCFSFGVFCFETKDVSAYSGNGKEQETNLNIQGPADILNGRSKATSLWFTYYPDKIAHCYDDYTIKGYDNGGVYNTEIFVLYATDNTGVRQEVPVSQLTNNTFTAWEYIAEGYITLELKKNGEFFQSFFQQRFKKNYRFAVYQRYRRHCR